MQEEREDFFRPLVDEEALLQSRYSYTQPASRVGYLMEDMLRDSLMEDIIPVAEAAGRRMSNYEARREERIERDFGLRRRTGDECGIFQTGTWMTLAEEQSFVERIAKKVEERIVISLEKRTKKLLEGLGVLQPLGQRSVEPKITEVVQPPHELRKEDIVMDANHSGAKRKAVSPLEQVVNESTFTGVPKKTLNEDWSCTLCQVTATSKHGLDEHFQGKKHKFKEAAMRLKNERKNFNNGLSLNKKAKCDASYLCEAKQKSVSPPEQVANEYTSTGVAIIPGEDWSCAICQFSETSKHALDAHLQGKKHKSKEADLRLETVGKNHDNGLQRKENDMQGYSRSKTIEADQKSSKHGKRKTVIWCEICRVGVTSEVAMEVHRKGKNHLKLLKDVPIQNIQIAHTVVDANLDAE